MKKETILLCCDGSCSQSKKCKRYTFDPADLGPTVRIRTEITLRERHERDCQYYQPLEKKK